MNWFLDNWYLLILGGVFLWLLVMFCIHFLQLPTPAKIAKVKEWLLLAVIEAERQLGSGTGQLKLRLVYDWFVKRFPAVATWISFDTFAQWVDESLEQMQDILRQNVAVKKYVRG